MSRRARCIQLILLLILVLLLSGYTIGGKKPIVVTTPSPAARHEDRPVTQPGERYWVDDTSDLTPQPTTEQQATATQPVAYPPPERTPGYPYP